MIKKVSKKYCIYSMKNNKNEKKISNLSECVDNILIYQKL